MSLIEFEHVFKRYPGNSEAAVDDLNLCIEAGEFLTLLGPSGSGKTTTLMLLAGFEAPSSGVIRFDGASIESLPPHQRNMGVVFQSYTLFPHMTVAQNVAFPLLVRKVPSGVIAEKVSAALAKVQLESYAQRKPSQLSGGQQQRVALARALVFEPRLVLMDEPLSALDKKLREEMQLEIRRLHRDLGVTMVFVTHDQDEAMTLSDRVAVFNRGRIEQIDTPQALYDSPINPFVANFLGDSNTIGAVLDPNPEAERRPGIAVVRIAGGQRLLARNRDANLRTEGTQVTLCVRPEFLQVAASASLMPNRNCIDAVLLDVINKGDHWRLVAGLYQHGKEYVEHAPTWFAKISSLALPPNLVVGQSLCLGFRSEDAWVF